MSKTFVSGVSAQTVTKMGFDYHEPSARHAKAARMSHLIFKPKVPQSGSQARRKNLTVMRDPRGETDIHTNRFFDTFTKFQRINENLDVPSPSFRPAHKGKGLDQAKLTLGAEYQLKPARVLFQDTDERAKHATLDHSKVASKKDLTFGPDKNSTQNAQDPRKAGARTVARKSSYGSSSTSGSGPRTPRPPRK
jgi:hypothetical protein